MAEIIKTKRLVIKPFSVEDTDPLSELLVNDEIKKTYMIPDFDSREKFDRMVNRNLELSLEDDYFVRGIYLDEKLIGFVNDVEIEDSCIELGYAIHPDFWGNGYATEMFCAVIHELLGTRFTTIRAGAFSENPASIRVMEKCGMRKCPYTEQIEYRGVQHTCVYYEIKE